MKIVLTGGGSAGHVTPNLALIPRLLQAGWDIDYIGGVDGMERGLIEPVEGVRYHGIATGKLRRYFDVKNFTDPFRVIKGIGQAASLMGKIRPNVVFAKGGFVSVPVVYAAKMRGIPVVLHESDMTPGLANKLCTPMAKAVCTSFAETARHIKRGVHTGTPFREELFTGKREAARRRFGFTENKPLLLVTGGSQGAAAINDAVRGALPELLKTFDILHLCGKGKLDESKKDTPGYVQVEYLSEGMNDAYAATDLVLSRAGSNTICELLALRKPHLLIPYPAAGGGSRGDQIVNAQSFQQKGYSQVLEQAALTPQTLAEALMRTWKDRRAMVDAMKADPTANGVDAVVAQILKYAKT